MKPGPLMDNEEHLSASERFDLRLTLLSCACLTGESITSEIQSAWTLKTRQRLDQIFQEALRKLRKRMNPELLAELKLHLPTNRKPARSKQTHETRD